MAKAFGRPQRVADFLRKELSSLIQFQLRDPRLGMVSITDVEVSKDLSHARVFVTVLGCEDRKSAEPSVAVLNRANGFLRTEIARISTMRIVPALHFVYDESVQRGLHMSALIDQAVKSDVARHDDEQGDNEAP